MDNQRCGVCGNWKPIKHAAGQLGHCGVLVFLPASVLVEYGGSRRPWDGATCSNFVRKDSDG